MNTEKQTVRQNKFYAEACSGKMNTYSYTSALWITWLQIILCIVGLGLSVVLILAGRDSPGVMLFFTVWISFTSAQMILLIVVIRHKLVLDGNFLVLYGFLTSNKISVYDINKVSETFFGFILYTAQHKYLISALSSVDKTGLLELLERIQAIHNVVVE